jgi:hypothetical protein
MARMIKQIFIAIRFITPWVVRFLGACLRMMCLTVASLWVGVPKATKRMAEEWQQKAILWGLPTRYDTVLYRIFLVMAYLTIFGGWVIASYATVWLIHLVGLVL